MSSNLPPQERDLAEHEPPGGDDVLAAELVLGVLNAEARRSAQVRSETDRAFAVHVALWERRLAPWLAEIEPVAVPAQLWSQIGRRLGWQPEPTRGLWQSVALWRAATVLATLAALAIWLTRPPTQTLQPPVATVQPGGERAAKPVTTLAHDDGTPGWLASVDRLHGTVLVVPVPSAADAQGRVPELWIIAAGKAPRSLGLISTDKSDTVAVPQDSRPALIPGSVLAITLEPPGGAPRGVPTGPIIAKGAIRT
jgi:anti-sigma-K factor RskA